MASVVDIANLALSHLSISKTIGSMTELSEEARAVSAVYDLANEHAQREFAWGFNTDFVDLQLIKENPTIEWSFAYQYPNRCLKVRRFLMTGAFDTREMRYLSNGKLPFRTAHLDGRAVILTHIPKAVAEVSTYITDVNLYPADYKMALSFLIAFYIAPRVTAGDPFKLGDRAFRAYQFTASKGMTASANEEESLEPAESELIRVRG